MKSRKLAMLDPELWQIVKDMTTEELRKFAGELEQMAKFIRESVNPFDSPTRWN